MSARNIILVTASGASILANAATYKYITSTYDVSQSLYFILALDAGFATTISTSNVLHFGYKIFFPAPGAITCTMEMLGSLVLGLVQPFFSLFISYIRYKRISLNLPNGWKPESELISMSVGILVLILAYLIPLYSLNGFFDWGMFDLFDLCMNQDNPQPLKFPGWIFTAIPVTIGTIVTAVLDYKSLKMVQDRPEDLDEKIAKRASFVSVALTIPYIFILAVLVNSDPKDRYIVIMILAFGLSIFRNPIVSACAFRVNEINRQTNAEEDRERRRQMEVNDALKKREDRNNLSEQRRQPEVVVAVDDKRAKKVNSVMPSIEC